MPLCSSQIQHRLTWDRTRPSEGTGSLECVTGYAAYQLGISDKPSLRYRYGFVYHVYVPDREEIL